MNEIKDPIKYMSDECLWAIYDGVKHNRLPKIEACQIRQGLSTLLLHWLRLQEPEGVGQEWHMGVSENREPQHSTLNSRILIIRTPK